MGLARMLLMTLLILSTTSSGQATTTAGSATSAGGLATTLAGGVLIQQNNSTVRSKNPNENPVMFCRPFQGGVCDEQNDHFGDVNGAVRFVRHICATCWLRSRKKASHAEGSEECPLNDVQ